VLDSGTTYGAELLVELDRHGSRPLRAQLEDGLRDAVREGRLPAGTRLPASRVLALDLAVSRRLVVDAYAQLLAEGYLRARHGAGTFVAEGAGPRAAPSGEHRQQTPAYDFFPGHPDLSSFPRRAWLRAMREALRDLPDRQLGYPDPRGAHQLRQALAGHLRRVRGVVADPSAIVVCSGAVQALGLLARALGAGFALELAVEDPGLPAHRLVLREHGARLTPIPVDGGGLSLPALARSAARAVLVTPAHQSPTGVALATERRSALLEWAAARDAVIIEDDYDSEHRYDRAPLGALQGLAPERVIYLGTVSKTLAPALRLGWMVLPSRLVGDVTAAKSADDAGSPTLDQVALARLLESGAYDRHLRQCRRRYRSRRDALVAAVARHLPSARVVGVAAGLHAIVRLPEALDGAALIAAARRRSVGVYPLGLAYDAPRPVHDGLVLGYADLTEPAIDEGVRRLAGAVAELSRANAGGAIAR
jgi:GntR family transcriptional regulator/MocR family aminotransferase